MTTPLQLLVKLRPVPAGKVTLIVEFTLASAFGTSWFCAVNVDV